MQSEQREYPAAVDVWLAVIVLGAITAIFMTGVYLLWTREPAAVIILGVGAVIVTILLVAGFPCRYTLTGESLLIRCGVFGMFEEEIPLRSIKKVALSRNPLSAPAPSLRRVRIDHEQGFSLISPKDRDGFIDEINRRRQAPD